MFNYTIVRQSEAISYIIANPITGRCDVMFTNGNRYSYVNVSRRAIVNLINQPNMSLGFWVNANIVGVKRVECIQSFNVPAFATA
jgi:hypothetical protein